MAAENVDLNRLSGVIIGTCRITGHEELVIEADRKSLPEVLKVLDKERTQVCGASEIVYESRLKHCLWDFSHLD